MSEENRSGGKSPSSPAGFFSGRPKSKRLFDAVARHIAALGESQVKVTKSQIAFRRKRNFALAWVPGQYLQGKTAPLVLTVLLPEKAQSSRWKEVVEPRPGRFTHHLEIYDESDVDGEVDQWLRAAWKAAG